jgi:exosortase/archaeosortase family protein
MKKRKRKIKNTKFKFSALFEIFIRYIILASLSIYNLWIFYFIFTPLTVYASYFLLHLVYSQISLVNNLILISGNFPIELIGACVAGSAYYLLLILNLSIPKIKILDRAKLILFSFLSFFIINVLRIFILSMIYVNGVSWFDTAHILLWYLGSIVFVVGIWFAGVKILKIKGIPFYSDLKYLFKKKYS